MSLRLQPTQVAIGRGSSEGRLVFNGQILVAVLVCLSADYEDLAGRWFLEAGFGSVDVKAAPTFSDLDAAQDWIAHRLAAER